MPSPPLQRAVSYQLSFEPTTAKPPSDIEANEVTDEDLDDPASDGQSVIGISLGHAQTYLASPSATDAEKKTFLQKGAEESTTSIDALDAPDLEFDNYKSSSVDGVADETFDPSRPYTSSRPKLHTEVTPTRPQPNITLPSPWRAGANHNWSIRGQEEERQASMVERLTRLRASTTPDAPDNMGWRRYVPSISTVPSFSRTSVTGFTRSASSSQLDDSANSSTTLSKSAQVSEGGVASASESTLVGGDVGTESNSKSVRSSTTKQVRYEPISSPRSSLSAQGRPSMLRRSTSDGSLRLQHTMSRASSLGDDDRWHDVHQEVNSRMKAIKDSLADSNLRLPRLPEIPPMGSWIDLQAARKYSTSLLNGRETRSDSPGNASSNDAVTQKDLGLGSTHKTDVRSPTPGVTKAKAAKHPKFTKAVQELSGDVVILGGYRGSVLRSAKPPHRQLWVPIKVGLNLRKVNLEVGLEPQDEEQMTETIIPSGMLKHIGPVDISRRLFKRLPSTSTRTVHDYGYDWRLSPYRLCDQLIRFLESLPCNAPGKSQYERGATVIAHSLGGLLTRRAINLRPELFRSVVYAGVPNACVNILGPLRNGDSVLMSQKVLTAQVNFTFRTSTVLLPLDGKCFFNPVTKEQYDVDFFDPHTWDNYCLSPVISRPLPPYTPVPPPAPSTVGGLVNSMASILPSFTRPRRTSSPKPSEPLTTKLNRDATEASGTHTAQGAAAPQMTQTRPETSIADVNAESNPSTTVTIPKSEAMAYLTRTLAETKAFKLSLAHKPDHAYPPTACIYGKAVPTVCGAQVRSCDAIRHSDAFDNLAFASGDGVVLARAAQLPEGYRVVKGGVISSERGHVTLLSDLEAVGKALCAIETYRKGRSGQEAV